MKAAFLVPFLLLSSLSFAIAARRRKPIDPHPPISPATTTSYSLNSGEANSEVVAKGGPANLSPNGTKKSGGSRRKTTTKNLPSEKPNSNFWESWLFDPWCYVAPLVALLIIASVIAGCMELCRRKEPATPTWSNTGLFPSVGEIVRGSTPAERVPATLRACTRAIESRWLQLPDLYKRTGEKTKVDKLLARLRSSSGDVVVDNEDPDTVVGVVITFLQQLAEPLIHTHLYEKAASAVAISDKTEREKKLRDLLNESDGVNDHSNLNGMTRTALATVFTPFVVGWGSDQDTGASIMIALLKLDTMQIKYRKFSSTEATPVPQNLKCTLRKMLVSLKSVSNPPARGVYPALADVCPPSGRRVPSVLTRLVREMEQHLRVDGIYKRCADAEEVETILRNIDTVDLSTIDAHTLAECIKTFLWQIQEPLIPSTHLDAFIEGLSAENMEIALRRCVERLPSANRDTLEFMMRHWRKVLAHSLHNGLTVSSLATVLAPFVVGFSNERVSIDVTEALLRIDS